MHEHGQVYVQPPNRRRNLGPQEVNLFVQPPQGIDLQFWVGLGKEAHQTGGRGESDHDQGIDWILETEEVGRSPRYWGQGG